MSYANSHRGTCSTVCLRLLNCSHAIHITSDTGGERQSWECCEERPAQSDAQGYTKDISGFANRKSRTKPKYRGALCVIKGKAVNGAEENMLKIAAAVYLKTEKKAM